MEFYIGVSMITLVFGVLLGWIIQEAGIKDGLTIIGMSLGLFGFVSVACRLITGGW